MVHTWHIQNSDSIKIFKNYLSFLQLWFWCWNNFLFFSLLPKVRTNKVRTTLLSKISEINSNILTWTYCKTNHILLFSDTFILKKDLMDLFSIVSKVWENGQQVIYSKKKIKSFKIFIYIIFFLFFLLIVFCFSDSSNMYE